MKAYVKKIGLLLSLTIPMVLGGCAEEQADQPEARANVISVQARELALSSRELTKSFTGTLEGERQAVLTPKISEAVVAVKVKEGDAVRADQVLIELDRTGPTSNYAQANSVFQNARKHHQKMKFLFEEGAISESQYDAARTEYEVAEANFESARRMVAISTPISGTVTSINVSLGDFVYPGQALATVAKIDTLRMKLGVTGTDLRYFQVGNRVTVDLEASSELPGQGRVATVAESADPVTRSFEIEIEVDNGSGRLKPGMFARAGIVTNRIEDVIIVPFKSIIKRDNKDHAFVVEGGEARLKAVTLGADFNGFVEVREGLDPGDTLVTVGQDYLDDGYQVKIAKMIAADDEEMEN